MRAHRIFLIAATAAGFSITLQSTAVSQEYRGTWEQQRACTPDLWRLCGAQIPDVDRIVACLRRNTPQLSDRCRAVFAQSDAPSRGEDRDYGQRRYDRDYGPRRYDRDYGPRPYDRDYGPRPYYGPRPHDDYDDSAIEVSPRCELRLKGFAKMWAVTGCLGTVMGDVDRESTVTKTDGS
jgi:hypothetical protein